MAFIIFYYFSMGINFRRQNLTSKVDTALKGPNLLYNLQIWLVYYWANLLDDGPPLRQHWANDSCSSDLLLVQMQPTHESVY